MNPLEIVFDGKTGEDERFHETDGTMHVGEWCTASVRLPDEEGVSITHG